MPKTLSSMISSAFKPPAERKPDVHRKAREAAKALAKEHDIEIEPINSGFNVWQPSRANAADPFEGDHYAEDWSEVLTRVRTYAGV